MQRKWLTHSLLVLLLVSAFGANAAIERRRSQFPQEPGHYIFPTPYSLPGIGNGLAVVAAGSNLLDSYVDAYAYALTGDLKGGGFAVSDIHLLPQRLILDITGAHFSKAAIQAYKSRGMASGKDDYYLLDLNDNNFLGWRLTNTYHDRMFELYAMGYSGNWHVASLRDTNGNTVQNTQNAASEHYGNYTLGFRIDYSDDYQDPRKGVRLDVSRRASLRKQDFSPDEYALFYNLTGYIPFGVRDTLALNYYQSDAVVTKQGVTDPLAVQQHLGVDCSTGTVAQQADCLSLVNNTINANRYGTVDGLGGTARLRGYKMNRYLGAHARFVGAEYRWNLTEEFTPFDIGIAKDIRTAIQIAFFVESGTVADRSADLGNSWSNNLGTGIRFVTASGLVIRGDIAFGKEGKELSIILGYPWESF
ncbi:MAG: hypothetical protein HY080_08740 [Gammaproteobacteria bacterium]|nr:hypothetical protein [Gammaproteobacteria bacterium]